jgi:DNA-binding LacI/PurR family transcriptional regulator
MRSSDHDAYGAEVPIHRRITDAVATAIEQGRYPVGAQLPSEPKLAADFGVSRGTLRQALSNLRLSGHVEVVPGRGTFVRRPTPVVVEARRRVVGLVVPSVTRPALPEVLNAIEDELHRRGYSLLVGNSGNTHDQEVGRIQRILDEGVGGMIVLPIDGHTDVGSYQGLLGQGFPVVLIDRHVVGLPVDAVLADNVGGAFLAVTHLIELGHRRIAFVSSDNLGTTSVAERLQGYQLALSTAGLPINGDLLFTHLPVVPPDSYDEDRVTQDNARLIVKFLSDRPLPTAIFALHDRIALSVLEAATSLGLDVPRDLSVVGFDDDPLAETLRVPLTTVAQPREQIGRVAARVVADRIEARPSEVARIVLPTTLIVRRSTGKAPPD